MVTTVRDERTETWRLDLTNAPPGMPCVLLLVLAFAGVVMLLSLVFHSMKKTFQFALDNRIKTFELHLKNGTISDFK